MRVSPLALALIVVCALMAVALAMQRGEWAGADELAEEAISKVSPGYEPWFSPVWEPPSGEIESLIFSLQAAAGALILGYYIGYYRGRAHAR